MIITDLKPVLDTLYETKTPLLLLSSPGIGKSSIINQFAQEKDMGLIEIRGASSNPAELADIKYISQDEVHDAPQAWVPTEAKVKDRQCPSNGIIFIDELADSMLSVQSTLQRLFLDRKLGSLELASGWWVCAASNKQEHKAAAGRISTALLNRAMVLNLDPDADALVEYLMNQPDVDPSVVGFVRFRPDCLKDSPVDCLKQEIPQFCSPRSLHATGKFVHEMKTKDMALPDHVVLESISGLIGQGRGTELFGFMKLVDELPDIFEVIENPKETPVPHSTDAQLAIAYSLLGNIEQGEVLSAAHYIIRLPVEISVVAIKDMFKQFGNSIKKVLASDPDVSSWMLENFKYVY